MAKLLSVLIALTLAVSVNPAVASASESTRTTDATEAIPRRTESLRGDSAARMADALEVAQLGQVPLPTPTPDSIALPTPTPEPDPGPVIDANPVSGLEESPAGTVAVPEPAVPSAIADQVNPMTPADAVGAWEYDPLTPSPLSDRDSAVVFGRSTPYGFEIVEASVDEYGFGGKGLVVSILSDPHDYRDRLWTGSMCVTGSGRYAAVVFAPVEDITLDSEKRGSVANLAVVDLVSREASVVATNVAFVSGAVGCGPSDEIAGLRHVSGNEGGVDSVIIQVDGASPGVATERAVPGVRLSEVAPVGEVVYASVGPSILAMDEDGLREVFVGTRVGGIMGNTSGGVDFLDSIDTTVTAYRIRQDSQALLSVASGQLGQIDWFSQPGGANVVLALDESADERAVSVTGERLPIAISGDGQLLLSASPVPGQVLLSSALGVTPIPVGSLSQEDQLDAWAVLSGGEPLPQAFPVDVDRARDVAVIDPAQLSPESRVAECRSPIPEGWVYEPSLNELRATASAVASGETFPHRPEDFNSTGLPEFSPSEQFPFVELNGGGRVPPELLLAVMADRSSLRHSRSASRSAWGPPAIASDHVGSECRYGIAGFNFRGKQFSGDEERIIVADYQAAVAALHRELALLWNSLYDEGFVSDGHDPEVLSDWYSVLWAYSGGTLASAAHLKGLAWSQNPLNGAFGYSRDEYDPRRSPYYFRGDWTFAERVLTYASVLDLTAGAPLLSDTDPADPLPSQSVLPCSDCQDSLQRSCDAGDCLMTDPLSPSHGPVSRSAHLDEEQPIPDLERREQRSDTCREGELDAWVGPDELERAIIVDNDPGNVDCATVGAFTSKGFLDRNSVSGHNGTAIWAQPDRSDPISATWTPPADVKGWHRVLVFSPELPSKTYRARYRVTLGDGTPSRQRIVNQATERGESRWIDLGIFNFQGSELRFPGIDNPRVTLTAPDHGNEGTRLVADAVAFVPVYEPPAIAYVALGDSYASGEGAENYYSASDIDGGNEPDLGLAYRPKNKCHRSRNAYPVGVFDELRSAATGPATFAFLACSGSTTYDLMFDRANDPTTDGAAKAEEQQLLGGWLDSNTTHVTLQIGGNDLYFGKVVYKCVLGLCIDWTTNYRGQEISALDLMSIVLPDVADRVEQVWARIEELAPFARKLGIGYPDLIQEQNSGGWCTALDEPDPQFLLKVPGQARAGIKPSIIGGDRRYVSLQQLFDGHEACWADAWMLGLVTPPGGPFAHSFHPDATGHVESVAPIHEALTSDRYYRGGDVPLIEVWTSLDANERHKFVLEPDRTELRVQYSDCEEVPPGAGLPGWPGLDLPSWQVRDVQGEVVTSGLCGVSQPFVLEDGVYEMVLVGAAGLDSPVRITLQQAGHLEIPSEELLDLSYVPGSDFGRIDTAEDRDTYTFDLEQAARFVVEGYECQGHMRYYFRWQLADIRSGATVGRGGCSAAEILHLDAGYYELSAWAEQGTTGDYGLRFGYLPPEEGYGLVIPEEGFVEINSQGPNGSGRLERSWSRDAYPFSLEQGTTLGLRIQDCSHGLLAEFRWHVYSVDGEEIVWEGGACNRSGSVRSLDAGSYVLRVWADDGGSGTYELEIGPLPEVERFGLSLSLGESVELDSAFAAGAGQFEHPWSQDLYRINLVADTRLRIDSCAKTSSRRALTHVGTGHTVSRSSMCSEGEFDLKAGMYELVTWDYLNQRHSQRLDLMATGSVDATRFRRNEHAVELYPDRGFASLAEIAGDAGQLPDTVDRPSFALSLDEAGYVFVRGGDAFVDGCSSGVQWSLRDSHSGRWLLDNMDCDDSMVLHLAKGNYILAIHSGTSGRYNMELAFDPDRAQRFDLWGGEEDGGEFVIVSSLDDGPALLEHEMSIDLYDFSIEEFSVFEIEFPRCQTNVKWQIRDMGDGRIAASGRSKCNYGAIGVPLVGGEYQLEISSHERKRYSILGRGIASEPTPVSARKCRGRAVTHDMTDSPGYLSGTSGDDVILGSAGADRIHGGGGDDVICTGGGTDYVVAGDGDDLVFVSSGRAEVHGGNGNDEIRGGSGKDVLYGGNGQDVISGGGGRDWIYGGNGNDSLAGGHGGDIISGGKGNDKLKGGGGADYLNGNAGRRDDADGGGGMDHCWAVTKRKRCEKKAKPSGKLPEPPEVPGNLRQGEDEPLALVAARGS